LKKINEPVEEVKVPARRLPISLKKEVSKKTLNDSELKVGDSENQNAGDADLEKYLKPLIKKIERKPGEVKEKDGATRRNGSD